MKKLLAILLALAMVFTFAACTGGATEDNSSNNSSKVDSTSSPSLNLGVDDNGSEDDNDNDNSSEELVLEGTDKFVVCALESNDTTLTSIKDIKGKKVASIFGTDGEAIANYYGAEFTGFGSPQDGISAFKAKNFEFFIMKEVAAKSYEGQGIKIVLDPIVIE